MLEAITGRSLLLLKSLGMHGQGHLTVKIFPRYLDRIMSVKIETCLAIQRNISQALQYYCKGAVTSRGRYRYKALPTAIETALMTAPK